MTTRSRYFSQALAASIRKPFVHLLFGARQTGKSTLIRSIIPPDATILDFSDPGERSRFSSKPGLLVDVCRALPEREGGQYVFIDEAQTVPTIFDAVQSLYDRDKDRFRFILCGSSARKLRASGANLLPGRSVIHMLQPLIEEEYEIPDGRAPTVRLKEFDLGLISARPDSAFPARSLENRMVFGDLPGVSLLADDSDRAEILRSYAIAYLEEEIRREASVRDWGCFLRFLQFAAIGSGGIVNLQAVSRESGVSAATIKSYYQLLEDMFMGFSIPAFSGSARKNALSSPRFLFFDTGVRNAAASIPLNEDSVNADQGGLFEQFIGLQLHRKLAYSRSGTLSHYRTRDGAEVDFIIEIGKKLIPVEVKWTENPSLKDARHLRSFVADHADRCERGIIVSRCPYILALDDNIRAIPWWMM